MAAQKTPTAPKGVKILTSTDIASVRKTKIGKLNKEHPEYLHYPTNSDVTNDTLRSRAAELVTESTYGNSEGNTPLTVGNDIIARVPRSAYNKYHSDLNEQSFERSKDVWQAGGSDETDVSGGQPTGPDGKYKMLERGKLVPKE